MSLNIYFKKRLVVIIGASEGIGLATAILLVQSGENIVFCSRNNAKLESAYQQLIKLKKRSDQIIDYKSMDATDSKQVADSFSEIISQHKIPDIVINCVGYAKPGYIEDLAIDDCKDMVNANLFSCINIAKVIVPYFIKNNAGHIVNTSSIAGFVGLFGYTAYCASKFAVIGFSKALQQELKPYNIAVSVLCPPNTKTPGLEIENRCKPDEVLQVEEKAKPMDADKVAIALLKGIRRKRFLIHPNIDGQLAYYLSRLFPGLLDYIVRRPIK